MQILSLFFKFFKLFSYKSDFLTFADNLIWELHCVLILCLSCFYYQIDHIKSNCRLIADSLCKLLICSRFFNICWQFDLRALLCLDAVSLMLLSLNELYKIEMNCRLIADLLYKESICLIKRSYRRRLDCPYNRLTFLNLFSLSL